MYFLSFYTKFPEIAEGEVGMVEVKKGAPVPAGLYAFLENYCDDPECDCRKVMINVVDAKKNDCILATIGYGWESEKFYIEWMGDKKMGKEMTGAYLEMAGVQSKHAREFLQLWKMMTVKNKEYVKRLKKHYVMWKRMSNFEDVSVSSQK